MVTNTEANGYVSSIEWSEEGIQLKEFARKQKLPTVGRVVKGHYEGIGVPSLSCPSSRQTAFWLNGGQVVKVAAQCVKFKESRGYNGLTASRPIPFGPKLSIPDNYEGFFEILSEEGRSVRCIESAHELIKRLSPSTSVLIRETVKVYLPKGDNENIVSDKSRSLSIGEVLTIANPNSNSDNNNHLNGNNNNNNCINKVNNSKLFPTSTIDPLSTSSPCDNQINKSSNNNNSGSSVSTSDSSSSTSSSPSPMSSTCSSTTGLSTHCQPTTTTTTTTSSSSSSPPSILQSKYIKCYTSKGEIVYLPIEGKGRYSPIAKEESISGVHRISSLLTKRLPLMVRLVFGRPPAGFKSFTPEMRLFSIFSEDYLMALPVTKESASVVTIPLSASLKIVAPKNGSFLSTHRYHETLLTRFNEKTSGQPSSLLPNRIQVCEGSSLGKGFKNNWKEVNPEVNHSILDQQQNGGITVTSESVKYNHKKRLFQSDSIELIGGGEKNNNNQGKLSANNTSSGNSDKSKTSCDSETMGIDEEPTLDNGGVTSNGDELNVVEVVDEGNGGGGEEEDEDDDGSCYDEIDQIYDYVRGFAPLPEKLRPHRPSKVKETPFTDPPPEPPPIETIPSLGQNHHGHSVHPSHHHQQHQSQHHYPSGYRRLSYPTVFHEIIPKMGLYEKKMISPSDHIYEKVPVERKGPEKRFHGGNLRTRDYHNDNLKQSDHHHHPNVHHNGHRIPMRSNSTGKMYLPLNGLPIHNGSHQQSTNPVHHHPQHHQPNLTHHHQQPPHHPLVKPKLFIKSNQQPTTIQSSFHNGLLINANPLTGHHHGNRKTTKLMRYAKGLSLGNENTNPYYNSNENDLINQNNSINNNYHCNNAKVNDDNNNKWTFRSSRSLTTSPLFNIRYKSLTNLHFITPLAASTSSKGGAGGFYDHHSNNTLASSSNSSGCKISSGSGRSVESPSDNITKAKKTRKLSRPLSFSNLFWDLKNDLISSSSANRDNNNSLESMYPDPRISSSPNGGGDSSAMVLTQLVNNVTSNRRVGTLYL